MEAKELMSNAKGLIPMAFDYLHDYGTMLQAMPMAVSILSKSELSNEDRLLIDDFIKELGNISKLVNDIASERDNIATINHILNGMES